VTEPARETRKRARAPRATPHARLDIRGVLSRRQREKDGRCERGRQTQNVDNFLFHFPQVSQQRFEQRTSRHQAKTSHLSLSLSLSRPHPPTHTTTTCTAPSLLLEVFLYFGKLWDIVFWVLSFLIFIYKGHKLPYPDGAYELVGLSLPGGVRFVTQNSRTRRCTSARSCRCTCTRSRRESPWQTAERQTFARAPYTGASMYFCTTHSEP
jgi:hypothetical protein